MLHCKSGVLRPEDFELDMRREALLSEVGKKDSHLLEEMERRLIAMVLEKHRGNITKASKTLGISFSSLVRKMKFYGLKNSRSK